jgi:FkbM family methyltransferase
MFDYNDKQYCRAIAWHNINGDQNLRIDYELNENSVVFDVGGYLGDWASPIFESYHCYIHIFEPINEYVEGLRRKFAGNSNKIFVHPFGLSNNNEIVNIGINRASSSTFILIGEKTPKVTFVKAIDFINENKIDKIDLMKINIEGSEYDLLEHLIESGFVRNIKDIQVQFHDFVPNAEERMEIIQGKLKETHYLTYQFEFVWENWRRQLIPDEIHEARKEIIKLYEQLNFINSQLNIARKNDLAHFKSEIDRTSLKISILEEELKNEKKELQNKKKEIKIEQEQRRQSEILLNIYRNSNSYKIGYFLLHPWDTCGWLIKKIKLFKTIVI